MAEGKRKVDVGLPVPLGDYSYLPPVQTGMNDAVEEKAMNPVLAWLAGQGIDVAAEQTGIKDVLRERGAGLLNMLGIGEAKAAESPQQPPVQTGFKPDLPVVVAQDVQGGGEFGSPPADIIRSSAQGEFGDMSRSYGSDGTQLYSTGGRSLEQFRRPDVSAPYRGRGNIDPNQYDAVRQYIDDENTPPVSVDDEDTDEVLKDRSLFGKLWDSTLGDEEWRTRKAMILNSMRLNPDAALTAAFASRIKDLRSNKRAMQLADQLEARGDTKNAELLRQYPEAADVILKAVVEGTGTTAYKNYQMAQKEGFKGSFMDYQMAVSPKQYESSFEKKAGEWGAEQMGEVISNADNAVRSVENANRVIALVEAGRAPTGLFADIKTNLARLGAALGGPEAARTASDAQLLEATLGSDVFPLIKSLGIGARGLDTPAEREFLLKVMTGTLALEGDTLKRMAEIRRKYAERAIDKYNELYDKGDLQRFSQYSGIPVNRIQKPLSAAEIRARADAAMGM